VESLLTFIELGFRHILPLGLDHILFVAALFLTSTGWRSLLLQVTAFTLAHSITLGLAAAGFISAPANIVEPLIAASIVVVGLEAAFGSRKAHPWRLPVIFVFGLCHGLGFAAMMKGFLDGADFLTALVGFNIGVELGQLAVLAAAAIVALLVRMVLAMIGRENLYTWVLVRPAGLAIAAIGLWWTLERTGVLGTSA
jgi:hydrogenase/urease accessory protein HupE